MEATLAEEAQKMISEGGPVDYSKLVTGTTVEEVASSLKALTGQGPVPANTPISFPEVTQIRPCTALSCRNGHQWQPLVALAKCGHGTSQGWNGCGNPILAIKLVNCPFCNEPTTHIKFRIDVTPPTPYPVPLCVPGSVSHAETIFVEVPLKKWKETEEAELAKAAEQLQKEALDGQRVQE